MPQPVIIQPGPLVSAMDWRGPGGTTDAAAMAEAIRRGGAAPPPPPPPGDWPGEPEGFVQRSVNDFEALPPEPSTTVPWGLAPENGPPSSPPTGQIHLATDISPAPPAGGTTAAEGRYLEGGEPGFGPGRVQYNGFGGFTLGELFWGMWVRVDADFINHPFQLKWHFIQFATTDWFWIDWRDNPTDPIPIPNLGLRFQGSWTPRSHWFNSELVRQNTGEFAAPEAGGAGNFKPFPKGEWVQLGLYLKYQDTGQENGIIRLWQDGDMIIELTDHVFPSQSLTRAWHEGTWGGGSPNVPKEQSWYVSQSYLSNPGA